MPWNILKSLEKYLGLSPQNQSVEQVAVIDELGTAVARLKDITKQLEAEHTSAVEQRIQTLKQEQFKAATDSAHDAMLASILSTHELLGTGIEKSTIEDLHTFYSAYKEKLKEDSHKSLRESILYSIINHLHRELGPVSWERLQTLIQQKSYPWPNPDGVSPAATQEDIETARRYNKTRVELSFLDMPVAQTSDILVGVVEIWHAYYPRPESSLYQETVLQSVASAIRVQLVEEALKLVGASETLISRIEAILASELQLVQEALSKRELSLEEAYHANHITSQACSSIIPQLVWSQVQPQLLSS